MNKKENMQENNVAAGLAVMLDGVRKIAEGNVSEECAMAAESALESLLKSSAIHGFNTVNEDK